ncbi:MAG: hypothetical protein KAT57_03995 [Candidatus Lokiarchaeota archaeon]|nr:hypothetical protein [Candidatus Lokiarchaeota archaeon]
MPSQKPLSKKKITQQTISITPELKDRIENYVIENQKKNPKDKRFKSVSAFYNYVLKKTMNCFDKGKNLDDFENYVDSEFKNFFDRISFKAVIPYYEEAIRPYRYSNPTFEKIPSFFLTIRRFYMKMMESRDILSIQNTINRIKNYLVSNNLTKEFKIDLFTGKSRTDLSGVFEYAGIYKNLCLEFCKYTASFFGILGIKITNVVCSEKDIYYRFDLKATDLFFRDDLAKSERIKLMDYNISYFINYSKTINDKDYYLWMKIAEDKNAVICFNNEETQNKWINLIENEITKFSDKDDSTLQMLKFFEKLHWIEIESEKDLSFRIRLSKSKYTYEREFLLENLSRKSKISHENEKFYLKDIKS